MTSLSEPDYYFQGFGKLKKLKFTDSQNCFLKLIFFFFPKKNLNYCHHKNNQFFFVSIQNGWGLYTDLLEENFKTQIIGIKKTDLINFEWWMLQLKQDKGGKKSVFPGKCIVLLWQLEHKVTQSCVFGRILINDPYL